MAQGSYTVNVFIHSLRDEAFAKRGYSVEPWAYADGTPVGEGERFRLIAVEATSSANHNATFREAFAKEQSLVKSGEARVVLDAMGGIQLVGFPPRYEFPSSEPIAERTVLEAVSQGAASVTQIIGRGLAAGTIGTANAAKVIVAPTDDDGEPQTITGVTRSTWNFTHPSSGKLGSGWWLFVVVEDSRSGVALAPNATPWRVASSSAAVMDDCTLASVDGAKPLFCPNSGAPMGDAYNNAYVSAPTSPMTATALPAAVTAASGTTYTEPAQIEALFAPAFAAFAQETDGFRLTFAETADGKPQSRLKDEPVPEGLLYSVFTATSLAGPWKTLDAVIREKGLALDDEKGYTRCQLSDLSGKVLPTFEDKTRFYRVQQSTTSQGE